MGNGVSIEEIMKNNPMRQTMYLDKPWQMLVVCIMLNRTNYKQVDSVRDEFFERWPDPETLLKAETEEISELLRPLGFYNRRAKTLKKFSQDWIDGKEIKDMSGIGKYALDSWKIFQENRTDVEPTDKKLIMYLEWKESTGSTQSENRVI